jgi:hypothetical protein
VDDRGGVGNWEGERGRIGEGVKGIVTSCRTGFTMAGELIKFPSLEGLGVGK